MAAARRLMLAALSAGAAALAGCGTVSDIGKTVHSARDFTPSDFCADLLARAYPEAGFEVTDTASHATGLATSVVDLKAHRADPSVGTALATNVAVECGFDHNVLIDFHWTQGPFR